MKKIEKFIDISGVKKCKSQLDWKNSIGCECNFAYGNITGTAIISGTTHKTVIFSINNKSFELNKSQFIKAGFGNVLSEIEEFKTKIIEYKTDVSRFNFKHSIGEVVNNITIISKKIVYEKGHPRLAYVGKCNVCGDEEQIFERSFEKYKTSCKVCNGTKVLPGFNDIATADSWMVKYFANVVDATKYKSCSNNIVDTICPECGAINKMCISDLKKRGHDKCKCSSKGYYSERFFAAFLDQMNIPYIQQLTHKDFEWVGKYKYDFWFTANGESFIVETNGVQHYEPTNNKHFILPKIQENDRKKEVLGKQYVDHYIQLDCRKSTLDYLSNSILSSELSTLLRFDKCDTDWQQCHSVGSKFLYKRQRQSEMIR